MEINNTSKVLIKELAEFIALEYDEIPTPLEKIIDSEDLKLFYDDYEDAFDGTLIYDNGYFIHLNTKKGNRPNTQRGRFTLAHELGHYFIDDHRIGLRNGLLKPHPSKNNTNSHQKIEREADYFASCLLMPEARFNNDCEGFKHFDFSLIENLSKIYNVSITACAIRFADIGTHPIMIVYCEDNKIIWKWNSNDFPYRYLAEQNSKIPIDSLVGQYFNLNTGIKRTEKLWAIDWFDGISNEDLNNTIFEHIIPYRNKALSVIWAD
ncbi:ImmA/IrrE family metallo-endopeptidase [Labilibaculum euxinus]